MPNRLKGEVPLRLADGREFVLLLDHEGLMQAAIAHTGKTKLRKLLSDLQPQVAEDGTIALDEDGDPVKDTLPATKAVLFGALCAHHPEMSLRDAGNLLFAEQEKVAEALGEAMSLSFPDAEGDQDRGNAAASPASKTSGASGAKPGSNRKHSGARRREHTR